MYCVASFGKLFQTEIVVGKMSVTIYFVIVMVMEVVIVRSQWYLPLSCHSLSVFQVIRVT